MARRTATPRRPRTWRPGCASTPEARPRSRAQLNVSRAPARPPLAQPIVVNEAALEYEIDREAVSDSLQCVHLLKEMYEYYYDAEVAASNPEYMDMQEDINPKMRAILVSARRPARARARGSRTSPSRAPPSTRPPNPPRGLTGPPTSRARSPSRSLSVSRARLRSIGSSRST